MTSYQRDGAMRFDANGAGGPNYYPNSFGGPAPDPRAGEPPFAVSGQAARQPYAHENDDFVQAGALYHGVMTDQDRAHLVGRAGSGGWAARSTRRSQEVCARS